MFVVSITYSVALSEVDALIPDHIAFLDQYYEQGNFIASGPKLPRTGGVILAQAENKEVLLSLLTQDPFYKAGIANYEVTEFVVSKKASAFSFE
ncbi:YciI family protein [Marinomonas mediterranea]|uniref:YciI family protein n=1 Tax=Marinomonas mediterranea TaxID=119864 RepID=UPI00234A16BD|nr:YciI family protein [Marinomonas mediterranea]WCN09578.1 GTP cyclohydrolase [Marinomonas mediterranea]